MNQSSELQTDARESILLYPCPEWCRGTHDLMPAVDFEVDPYRVEHVTVVWEHPDSWHWLERSRFDTRDGIGDEEIVFCGKSPDNMPALQALAYGRALVATAETILATRSRGGN
ncbi:MAG: hypothetical protein ACRDAX_06045 [Propionibacteriaceae bacterium]